MLNLHNKLYISLPTFSQLFISIFFIAFSISCSFFIIKFFQKRNIFQPNREIIWEKMTIKNKQIHGKRSLITMGGLAIIVTINVYSLFYFHTDLDIVILGNMFALLGFFDDYVKLKTKKSNGLSIKARLFFETIVSALFIYYVILHDPARNYIPIFGNIHLFNNLFCAVIWGVMIILSSSNSYNLTDGVDSLATTLGIYALIFIVLKVGFGIISLPTVLIFAMIGFLIFNWPPAKLIMGDIGSLGIGAMIGGFFYKYHLELFLPLIGLVFVIETISVMIQIYYIKVLHKRLFLMAPIHHHLEKKGWSKGKILLFFNLIGILTLLIGMK